MRAVIGQGAALLSLLLRDVSKLLGLRKIITIAYHPQGDRLVERFNRILTDMLPKEWPELGRVSPYVLLAYKTSMQQSTQESPFHPLYGRDLYLPSEQALSAPALREQFDIGSYQE